MLAIVFTRAENRRRDEPSTVPRDIGSPRSRERQNERERERQRERERERERKSEIGGWLPLNEDRKNRAVRLFNIQG